MHVQKKEEETGGGRSTRPIVVRLCAHKNEAQQAINELQ